MHVLVVCTGNICRSPTAERLLVARAAELGVVGLTVGSAGTQAVVGYGMEATARDVLAELGGDPAQFRARQLTPAMVGEADLVLAMTTRHRDKVLAESPRAMRRAFTLLEAERLLAVPTDGVGLPVRLVVARGLQPLDRHNDDVADPIGEPRAVFVAVGRQIDRAITALAQALAPHQVEP